VYDFSGLIDIGKIQKLMDSFCEALNVASAIIDLEGEVIIKSHWQRICTDFHRVNDESYERCIESDTVLANELSEKKEYAIYSCKNGLTDAAAPIFIEDEHVANYFIGQFFLKKPDEQYFLEQAERCGFDKKDYLEALYEVPIVPEEKLKSMVSYFVYLSQTLGEMGLKSKQIRLLVENMGDLISRHQPDSTVTYVSPSCVNILGYEQDELRNKPSFDFIHPYDIRQTKDIINDAASRQADSYLLQHRIKHKNGHYVWVETLGKLIYSKAGKLREVQCNVRDITSRKQQEEELRKAKEKAEHINQAKTEFLMNVSHDIRTPMNVMKGFNDLLMKTDLNNDQKKYCEMIKRKGEDLIRLIEDIIDISAVEKGKIRIHHSPVSICDIAEDIKETAEILIGEKDIVFECSVSDNVSRKLLGDTLRLKQILENLCSNAVKYTEKGRISLIISDMDKKHEGNERIIRFEVEDTGLGISEENISYIFEPYSRFYELGKGKENEGAGLGLHIVETLIREMGGEITVQSEKGKGSKFLFELKMEETGVPDDQEKGTMPEVRDVKGDVREMHILIAEDDKDNRELISCAFNDTGCDIHFACNGKEVLEEAKRRSYDLILMDLRMPGMDGFEATEIIRRDVDKKVPIIALTAHAMDWVEDKCRNAGMNGFIEKPVDIDKLKALIQQLI
jgi:PAS domain S-box-containing protein